MARKALNKFAKPKKIKILERKAKQKKKLKVSKPVTPVEKPKFDSFENVAKIVDLAMKEWKNKKNDLFEGDGSAVFLQVTLFKVPHVEEMVKRRIVLKHNPTKDGHPEVCLMVRDRLQKNAIRRTTDEMIDETVEYYENLLKRQKITSISKVMPYKQLKSEYNTYELQRKLVNRFDVFLCESSLLSRDPFIDSIHLKIFHKKNRYPIPVRFKKCEKYNPSIARVFNDAINSSVYHIKPGSDNYSIKVGNTLQPEGELADNVSTVVDKISQHDYLIPGGFKNVRAIYIKAEKSMALPLYMSLDSGNDVPVPYVEPNAKMVESVEGELSTQLGKKFTVLPTGDVFTLPCRSDESDMEEDKEEEDAEKINQIIQECMANKKKLEESDKKDKKKKRKKPDSDDEDDDLEDEIDSAEQRYLSTLDDAFEDSDEEKKVVKKDGKGKKKQKSESRPVKKMKKEENLKPKVKDSAKKVQAKGEKKKKEKTKQGKKDSLMKKKNNDVVAKPKVKSVKAVKAKKATKVKC